MAIESDLGTDAIYNEPAADLVSRWSRIVNVNQQLRKPFSMFWVAGPEDKIESAINYIAEQLGVDRKSAIEFDSDPNEWDVTNRLMQFANQVRSMDGNRLLMIARGFERVLTDTTDWFRLSRAGHDWDQRVVEDPKNTGWGKLYTGMEKHLIIITTIGFSSGPEVFEKTVCSALGSDFTTGFLELK